MNKKPRKAINHHLIAILFIFPFSTVAQYSTIDAGKEDFEIVTMEGVDDRASASEAALTRSSTPSASMSPGEVGDDGRSLADQLAENLGITAAQGAAGAGSVFRYAKLKLNPQEFQMIRDGIPDMDSLLNAGPNTRIPDVLTHDEPGDLELAALLLKDDFDQFGLAPDMLEKFIPLIVEYVESQAGQPAAKLLQNALQGI